MPRCSRCSCRPPERGRGGRRSRHRRRTDGAARRPHSAVAPPAILIREEARMPTGQNSRRLPLRRPEELDAEQSGLYARIVGGPRASQSVPVTAPDGSLLGPFAVMALAPEVGDAVQQLGAALRVSTGVDPLTREAAILLVAAHHRCEFEWFAHSGAAGRAGLTEDQLAALRDGRVPAELPPLTTAVLEVVGSLLRHRSLDDAEYAAAAASLGEQALAEVVWLTGYYSMLAVALATFEPPNPLSGGATFT
ncbi:carboxymuconolactone decarboxylase family protein [Microbacterium lushaniae]|nr:carboxymuconolactone decarboxylase family protein [Microbacterium lushaniae]KAA9156116.1 carboxymuconolactone decarboxylase family protein [Microbacterium lushaniae]